MEVSSNWRKYMQVAKDGSCQSSSTRNGPLEVRTFQRSLLSHKKIKKKHATQQNQGVPQKPIFTKAVALDCEMVGIQDGIQSMLGRVSIVNSQGQTLYDTFVKPTEPVVDYRTSVSGVRPRDLENGVQFQMAQKAVADILKGRILVGHALKNDLKVLFLSHPRRRTRDTSRFKPFRDLAGGRTPSLKKLASELLGVRLQDGEHSSVEDAKAAMKLYNLYKKEWERSMS